jgi:integrase
MRLQFTGISGNRPFIKIHSTDEFKPFGVPIRNVPIILSHQTMSIEEAPTLWLADLAIKRGRTKSPRTWDTYADNILDWLNNCRANNWDYLKPVEGWLGSYSRSMLAGTTVDGDPFAVSTINMRINTVCRFYLWLARNEYIQTYPFSLEERDPRHQHFGDMLAHAHGAYRKPRRSTLIANKTIPRAVSIETLRALRMLLDEREALIFDWAIACGLRLSEILAIVLKQIPDTRLLRNATHVDISFTQTKGLKPRSLSVPIKLLDRTHRYINSTRSRLSRKSRNAPDQTVFVSSNGAQASRKTVSKRYNAAVKCLGIKLRFHDLRHTYAIHRLIELERNLREHPKLRYIPLKVLQRELGHAYLSSTQIYLEALDYDANAVNTALASLLDAVQ